eukprot:7382888-Pyramimonas_sp.AAC.1
MNSIGARMNDSLSEAQTKATNDMLGQAIAEIKRIMPTTYPPSRLPRLPRPCLVPRDPSQRRCLTRARCGSEDYPTSARASS